MSPKVDPDLCSGCELCADICPEVFQMGDGSVAEVVLASPGSEFEDKIKEAAESCPSEAISL